MSFIGSESRYGELEPCALNPNSNNNNNNNNISSHDQKADSIDQSVFADSSRLYIQQSQHQVHSSTLQPAQQASSSNGFVPTLSLSNLNYLLRDAIVDNSYEDQSFFALRTPQKRIEAILTPTVETLAATVTTTTTREISNNGLSDDYSNNNIKGASQRRSLFNSRGNELAILRLRRDSSIESIDQQDIIDQQHQHAPRQDQQEERDSNSQRDLPSGVLIEDSNHLFHHEKNRPIDTIILPNRFDLLRNTPPTSSDFDQVKKKRETLISPEEIASRMSSGHQQHQHQNVYENNNNNNNNNYRSHGYRGGDSSQNTSTRHLTRQLSMHHHPHNHQRKTTNILHDSLLLAANNSEKLNDSHHSDSLKGATAYSMNYKTLVYVKRFINRLKISVMANVFSSLKEAQFKLINDFAHYEDAQSLGSSYAHNERRARMMKRNTPTNFKQALSQKQSSHHHHHHNHLGGFRNLAFLALEKFGNLVISQDSMYLMMFEMILLFVVFFQIYLIPLRVCFELNTDTVRVLTFLTLPIFFVEILLKCITSFYQDGVEVKQQKAIFSQYIKTSFLVDVVTFSALVFSIHFNDQWSSLLFLIRLNRIPKLINSLDSHLNLEHRFPSTFQLLQLLLLISTIAHFCGCGFSYLGQLQSRVHEDNWLQLKKIEHANWEKQYLYGLYFSFITMITVGYGDITPQSDKEIIYVLFMTLLSAATFGYSINMIGSVFREMQIKRIELKKQKQSLSFYLANRNITKSTQVKAIKELEHFQIRQSQDGQKGELVLQSLSIDVRNSVKREYFGRILEKYKLVKLNFSAAFVESLSLKLKEIFLSPDEVITQQGELQNKVFCLVSGELVVFQENQNNRQEHITIGKVKKGEFSDQRALFFEYKSEYGLKSAGISQVVYFSNEDFILTLKSFPQEFENYCMLRDNIIFQGKYVDMKCYSCGNFGHLMNNCKIVHYVADNELLLRKVSTARPQQPRIPTPRITQKYKTLSNHFLTSESLRLLRINAINHAIPNYQPLFEINYQTSDETFFNRMPEIFYEQGELFVNIEEDDDDDDYDDEDEEQLEDDEEDISNQFKKKKDKTTSNNNQQSPVVRIEQRKSQVGLDDSIQLHHTLSQQTQVLETQINPVLGSAINSLSIQQQFGEKDNFVLSEYNNNNNNNNTLDPILHIERRRSLAKDQSTSDNFTLNPRPSPITATTWLPSQGGYSRWNSSGAPSGMAMMPTILNSHDPLSAGVQPRSFIHQYIQDNGSIGGSIKQKPNLSSSISGFIPDSTSAANIKGKRSSLKQNSGGIGYLQHYASPSSNAGLGSSLTAAFNNEGSLLKKQRSITTAGDQQQQSQILRHSTLQQQQGIHISSQSMTSLGEINSPLKKRKEKRKVTINKKRSKQFPAELMMNRFQPNQFGNLPQQQQQQLAGASAGMNVLFANPTINSGEIASFSTRSQIQQQQQQQQYGLSQQQQQHHLQHQHMNHLHQGSITGPVYSNLNDFQQYILQTIAGGIQGIPPPTNSGDFQLTEFPYSTFEIMKTYKYYFTHGNIESIEKSYQKYQIHRIGLRKDLRKPFQRKLIKLLRYNLSEFSNNTIIINQCNNMHELTHRRKKTTTKIFKSLLHDLPKLNKSNISGQAL